MRPKPRFRIRRHDSGILGTRWWLYDGDTLIWMSRVSSSEGFHAAIRKVNQMQRLGL